MKNEGWSWGDLCGELIARGIDPDFVTGNEVSAVIDRHSAEEAAKHIEREMEADHDLS